MRTFILLAIFVAAVFGDVYMHNPRGSNNRYNEANTNTDNQNRLFDSQNNAKGGYCWGEPLYYYTKSELSIEWTNQHECGGDKADCQIVLQYMCGDQDDTENRIRDGTTTNTIPDDPDPAVYNMITASGTYEYGMHEPYSHYYACSTRYRNHGLWAADRNLQENGDATRTRQNNNGNRRGFECPEERDYWPYWHPSPWKDIAVLTTQSYKLCPYFKSNSQNNNEKWHCVMEDGTPMPENNEDECSPENWRKVESYGLPAPDCQQAPYSRDNHLGNGMNGYASVYNWTLPGKADLDCIDDGCVCVVRLRYNISTWDTDNWDKTGEPGFIDQTYNDENSPLYQDPMVEVEGFNLTLALNTDQYGRTFQDRSHVFSILPRPNKITDLDRIFNLNVRGKRGNIVQAYPAVEYDFVPTQLHVPEYSFVHFQWTGCDTNPNGNAGEGTEGTDRHNIVQIASTNHNLPLTAMEIDDKARAGLLFANQEEREKFAYAGQNLDNCPSYSELSAANGADENQIEEDPSNCFVLNAAERKFDGGAMQFAGKLGRSYHYMSTRNNNFTNRSQKATIKVETAIAAGYIALVCAGGVVVVGGAVTGGSYYAHMTSPHSAAAAPWAWLSAKL